MLGDGSAKYDHDGDGDSNAVGACSAHVRRSDIKTVARIIYTKGEGLKVIVLGISFRRLRLNQFTSPFSGPPAVQRLGRMDTVLRSQERDLTRKSIPRRHRHNRRTSRCSRVSQASLVSPRVRIDVHNPVSSPSPLTLFTRDQQQLPSAMGLRGASRHHILQRKPRRVGWASSSKLHYSVDSVPRASRPTRSTTFKKVTGTTNGSDLGSSSLCGDCLRYCNTMIIPLTLAQRRVARR